MLSQTLTPPMTIRPDEIMRSGSIQPFSVRSMDPVQFARNEINPFIDAIRPHGATNMPGALGMVTAQQTTLLGAGTVPSDTTMKRYYWAGGALIAGLLGGFLISKAV